MTQVRQTILHERHAELGAEFIDVEGWQLPGSYTSSVEEHAAVRQAAGVFDVSHLGALAIKWSWASEYLQARLTNDVDALEPWQCQYTLLPNEDGGIVDDLILFRLPKGFLLTVNSANVGADLEQLPEVEDVSEDWGILAVQGPQAFERLELEVERHRFRRETVGGVECLVSGTGYTGEQGCELLCNLQDIGALWDAVLDLGVVPCGMDAREMLRLEEGLLRHGHDMTVESDPYEAGLGRIVMTSKNFVGVGPLRRIKRAAAKRTLVSFVMEDEAVPVAGTPIGSDGVVTSSAFSPTLGRGIGLGYVWPGVSDPGTALTIDDDGGARRAYVHAAPVYEGQRTRRKRRRVRGLKP